VSAQQPPSLSERQIRDGWSPALVAALRWYLDRCEPHGNFKPCVHCQYTARHGLSKPVVDLLGKPR
jgi:hypothetical protein